MQSIINYRQLSICSHYLICVWGLIGISQRIGIHFGKLFANKYFSHIEYNAWAGLVTTEGKLEQMLVYLCSVIALFIYFSLAYLQFYEYFSFRKSWNPNEQHSLANIVGSRLFMLFINLLILLTLINPNNNLLQASVAVWLVLFVYPFVKYRINDSVIHLAGYFCLLALVGGLWFSFKPYFHNQNQFISNDYVDAGEKTRLLNNSYVDNTDYINQHRIGGMLRFDLKSNFHDMEKKFIPGFDYIRLNKSSQLNQYVKAHSDRFHYTNNNLGLFVDGKMDDKDKKEICALLNDRNACSEIDKFVTANKASGSRQYSDEENDFFAKNKFELAGQLRPGSFFHHHNALLGSINAYELGKPADQTIYFYGWLSAVILGFLMKLLGGISFGNYLSALYFVYPLYYTLFIFTANIIFRDIWYSTLLAVASLSSLYLISFEAIRIAPGFNPIRHFFDLFIIVMLYGYFKSEKENKLKLFYVVIFSTLSYLMNKEFGIILVASVVVSLLAKIVSDRKCTRTQIASIITLTMMVVLTRILLVTGTNLLGIYNFSGVFIPYTNLTKILSVLCLVSISYTVILFFPWKNRADKYLLLFLFCYGQGAMFYYIWNPSPTHLYSMIFPWLFIFAIFLRQVLSGIRSSVNQKQVLISIFIFIFLYCYHPAYVDYKNEMKTYKRIFVNHEVYRWDMPTAQFNSTMDPVAFKSAIAMMQKYESGMAVYMISKYENILPFLAGKYSQMPFLQTDLALVTPKENKLVIDFILTSKPEYLFVDADIARNHHGDTLNPYDSLAFDYETSHIRELMLDNFGKIFVDIKPYYQLVEKGTLISVYKRINLQS